MTNGLTTEEDTVRAPPLFWVTRRGSGGGAEGWGSLFFSLAEWRRRSRVARAHAAVNDTVPDGGASDSLPGDLTPLYARTGTGCRGQPCTSIAFVFVCFGVSA